MASALSISPNSPWASSLAFDGSVLVVGLIGALIALNWSFGGLSVSLLEVFWPTVTVATAAGVVWRLFGVVLGWAGLAVLLEVILLGCLLVVVLLVLVGVRVVGGAWGSSWNCSRIGATLALVVSELEAEAGARLGKTGDLLGCVRPVGWTLGGPMVVEAKVGL